MTTSKQKYFKDKTITSSAKLLLIYIKENAEFEVNGVYYLSKTNEELAVIFSCTSVTICNWLNSLESSGYIEYKFSKGIRYIKTII